MKLNQLARCLVVMGLGAHAAAWSQEVQKIERVEITGSSIKRLKDEGALPVQVITAQDLARKGITNAEDMLRQLGANGTGADNATSNNNVFGADTDRLTGGTANANLRGLGPGSTLVLLNGRRVSTSGMSGGAVDLNSIPMAAIQRVEILKDGASAIYGTDAVGGVINFILKKDYEGAAVGIDYSTPFEKGGGTQRKASITAGKGSVERDGYNVMFSLSLTDNDILRGRDRDWATGNQPDRGLSPNSSSSPFANIITGTGTALGSGSTVGTGDPINYTRVNLLSLQGNCGGVEAGTQFQPGLWTPASASAASKASTYAGGRYLCNTDYGSQYMLAAPKKAENLVARGTFKIGDNAEAFLEMTASRNRVKAELTPGQFSTSAATGTLYPVNGPYYLNLKNYGVNNFDPTKPIAYRWRMQDFGNRVIENVDENSRLLAGIEGDWGDYSYKLGASIAGAKGYSNLIDGYAYTKPLVDALSKGLINPWVLPGQTQTPEAQALIESMKARGRLQGGNTTLQQVDGSLSGDLFKLPAGTVQFAAGFDLRRESYEFAPQADGGFNCVSGLSTGATDVLLCPGNSAVPKVSRNITAFYGELAVPVFKGLDLQLAVRHDQYSKIGGTTNPKIGFRYQPTQVVMFRGSYNTGFKAPSFQQLSPNTAPRDYTGTWSDPVRCPVDPTQCSIVGLDYTDSGNPNLKPEKSKQGTFGIVVSPMPSLTASADWWRVDLDQRIRKLTISDVLTNYQLFPDRIIRDANGNATLVQAGWINAADSSTSGIDWNLSYVLKHSTGQWLANINGTHMLTAKDRALYGLPIVDQVGKFNTRTLYLRDKISADLTWSRDQWSATLSTVYKSGYEDQDMTLKGVMPAGANTRVASYTTFNLFTTYTGFKNTAITVGIRNLLDKNPPFTHHDVDDVAGAGWDPRVADPFGRTLAVSVKYDFK